ncbi:MAG: helix-turn-helix transcriptional regulator [Nitrospirae bacterium]|nr:helix-turn-helix transcriptional regulator [Nitrospirota bacterium]
MDYKTRIKIIKGNRTLKDFAALMGIPLTTIHTYLNGREPSIGFVKRAHEKLNVNPEWLITGKGPIYKNELFCDDENALKSIIGFLKNSWPAWTEKERCWFETHFRRNFPEFEAWLLDGQGSK